MTEFISAKEPLQNIAQTFAKRGIRISIEAEELLKTSTDEAILEKLIALDKLFLGKEDVEPFLNINEMKTEIIRGNDFIPMAKEYESNIVVNHTRDVTGKSRTKGETENFINYFRNRYEKLSRFLRKSTPTPTSDLADIKKHVGEKSRIIVMISDKKETKKGNLLFEVEDMTGSFKVVISSSRDDDKLIKKARSVLMDDIIAITGKVMEPYMIAEDIEWPDMPIVRERKQVEVDLAIAYISDMHLGSRYFLEKQLDGFVDWLHCRGESKDLAGKVKYVVIAGDSVDGIGVYPNQEKELVVKDIYKQYEMLDDFIQDIPDYMEVIIIPGNHDAVRRGEPQPALGKDLIKADVLSLGNPTSVQIEGIKHLLYHGTSLDSMIANIPGASYMHPEKVMVEYLKRRHLSPIYGGNPIIPENIDYMVIDDAPDVFHCGHIHRNGYTQYRGTLVINSGTFQDRTDYQIKQGHVPTPGQVPVYELKTNRLRTLDFSQ